MKYNYESFKKDTNKLIKKVKDFNPDVIVAIARGGLMFGHAIAQGLEMRNIQTIRTELYDDKNKRDEIKVHGECDLSDAQRVLIVDDIADSGETLSSVTKLLKKQNPHVEFKVATLFYKKSSTYKPDFWINEAKDWIYFFWDEDFKS